MPPRKRERENESGARKRQRVCEGGERGNVEGEIGIDREREREREKSRDNLVELKVLLPIMYIRGYYTTVQQWLFVGPCRYIASYQ